ncbi:MAG: DUF2752 domain-containing protein [Deltaproteobacteria bacterium]|nr:DUF2752 domain-containing protein [Deltaproteobacteria bacterium]
MTVDQLPHHSLCVYKSIFKMDCLGCGLTRAFLLIPRGEILQAVRLNAGAPILYILFIFYLVRSIKLKFNLISKNHEYPKGFYAFVAGLCMVLMTGHWFYKMYVYFSTHPLSEYLAGLIRIPFFVEGLDV